MSNKLVKAFVVEHLEVVFINSLFGLCLKSFFFESFFLNFDFSLLLLLSFLHGLLSVVLGDSSHDWIPLGEMLSLVDTNELGVVLENGVFFVILDMLDGVMSESLDLLSFLKTVLRPSVVILSITPSMLVDQPERHETNDDLVNFPNWVPRLWVMVGDRKTNSMIELWISAEPSILGEHVDSWSLLRIVVRASDLTNIESILASFWVLKSEDYEVPMINVFRIWEANEVVDDLAVLFDLRIVVFFSHFGFSLKSHLTGFVYRFSLHVLSLLFLLKFDLIY